MPYRQVVQILDPDRPTQLREQIFLPCKLFDFSGDDMLRRQIEIECSQFTSGAYWVHGSEYYAITATLEYSEELDALEDEELNDLLRTKTPA